MNRTNNYPKTISNIMRYWLMTIVLVAGMLTNANATSYYSQSGGSLNLNTLANWNSVRVGGGVGTQPATAAAFTTAGNIFVIQGTGNGGTSPHAVTSNTAWSISGSGTKLQIENGGSLNSLTAVTIGSTATFQIDNGGTYFHNDTITPSTTIFNGIESFGATSTMEIDSWKILNPPILTTGIGAPIGNLTMNLQAGFNANWNQSWSTLFTLCPGTFTVLSTGTGSFRFTGTGAFNLTVGNYVQSGGTVIISQGASGAPVFNVTNNFTLSGGTFIGVNGSGTPTIIIGGNFSQSAGTLNLVNGPGDAAINVTGTCIVSGSTGSLNLINSGSGNGTFTVTGNTTINTTSTAGIVMQTANATGSGIGIFQTQDLIVPSTATSTILINWGVPTTPNQNEFRIKGNFSKAASSGTFFTSSVNAAKGFVFNGTGTLTAPQTLSYAGTNSDYTNYTVNTGTVVKLLTNLNNGPNNFSNPVCSISVNGTLDCSTFKITGGGTNCSFVLSSGGTLATANTVGVISGTVGSVVNTITSTFDAASNYVFNGSLAQVTNFPTVGQNMANLTIDNSAGVSLNGTATINGILTCTTGTFTIASDLTIGTSATIVDNAAIILNSGVTWDCVGRQVTGTGAVTINGIFLTQRANGFNGTSSTAISNTISSLTIGAGSTIDYSRPGLTQTITAANYSNLTNSGNGPRTFSSSGIIGIASSFSPGTGLYTVTGSTVNFTVASIASFPVPSPLVAGGPNYNNLIVAPGTGSNYTMASSLILSGDFTENGTGVFRISNGSANSLTVNNLFLTSGTLTGNTGSGLGTTLNVGGDYNQTGGILNFNNSNGSNNGAGALNVTGNFNLSGGDAGLGNGASNAVTTLTITGNYNQSLASTMELINGTASTGNVTVTVSGTTTVNTTGTAGINLEAVSSTNGISIFQANSDVSFTGSSTKLVDFGSGTVSGNEFRIKGNFSKSGTGTFTTTSTNTTTATGFVFNGTGTIGSPQTLSYSNTNSDKTSYQVNTGTVVQLTSSLVMGSTTTPYSVFTVLGTLECGLNVISGGNTGGGTNTGFTLALGATLRTKNTGGVLGTITDLKTNYSTAANYVFNNTVSAQSSSFKSNPQQMANLTMSNPIGLNLTESAIVTGTLAFTAGIITTSTNFLTLNNGASVTGAGASNYVNGNVIWVYPTFGSPSLDFPIGSSTVYAPVTLAINSIGGNGQVFVTASTLTAAEPNEGSNASGIDQTKKSANYWTISKSGAGTFTTYDASFTIANTSNTGTPTNYVVRKFDSPSTWTSTTLGTHTNSVTQATGLTNFSEFEVGEKNSLTAGTDPSDATICNSENVVFTTSSSSSVPTTTIKWQVKIPLGSFNDITNGGVYSGANSTALTITGATTGMSGNQYRAAFRNINGEATTAAVTLTVNSNPSAPTSGGNQTLCNNALPATLTASAPGGSVVDWYANPTGGTALVSGNNNYITSTAGTYYAESRNNTGTGCLSATRTAVTLTVNANPAAPTSGGDQAVCDNALPATLSASAPGGSVVDWYANPTGGTALVSGNNNYNTSTAGTYYAESRNNTGTGCLSTTRTAVTLTVNSVPSNTFITSVSGTLEACNNDVYQMTANSAGGPGITYSWSTGASASVVKYSNTQTGPFILGPFSTSGNTVWAQFISVSGSGYSVCAKAVNSCGSSNVFRCQFVRGTVSVPGTISGSTVACPGNVISSYSCGASGGASVYTWTLNGSTSPITAGQGSNAGVQVTYPVGFTSGQLCVTAALACGTSSTSAPRCISVSNAPALPGVFTTGPSNICPGQSNVLFTVGASTYATGYDWSLPSNTTTVETPPYSTSVHVNFPANYTGAPNTNICAYATSSCASSAGRCKSVPTNIPHQPGTITGPLNNACGTTVNYSISAVAGADAGYTWTLPGAATNIVGQGTVAIQFDLNSTFGSGTVSVTANTSLCTPGTSTPKTITIYGKPATPGTITANPASWCSGTAVGFSVVNPVGVPLPTYSWTITNGTNMTGQGTNSVSVTWGTTGVPSSGPVKVSASNTCGGSAIKTQTFSTVCREENELPVSGLTFGVYPNPAHDKLTVSIDAKEHSDFKLLLRDVSGRIVVSENISVTEGYNSYKLDLAALSKGVYLLEINSSDDSWKTKVLVE